MFRMMGTSAQRHLPVRHKSDFNQQLHFWWLELSLGTPSHFGRELGIREDAQPQPSHHHLPVRQKIV